MVWGYEKLYVGKEDENGNGDVQTWTIYKTGDVICSKEFIGFKGLADCMGRYTLKNMDMDREDMHLDPGNTVQLQYENLDFLLQREREYFSKMKSALDIHFTCAISEVIVRLIRRFI